MNKTTDFGYKQIPIEQKIEKVAEVFHSVASKYDLMNDLMSLGIHRLWKRYAISVCQVKPGQRVLDVAGGTGDLAAKFARLVGNTGLVILADINDSMLKMGRDKLIDQGLVSNTHFLQANAECLPLASNSFDCITIAFGLRNVTYKDKALASMYRLLKPGGRLVVLEFSKPILPILSHLYDHYSFSILPKLGGIIAKDEESYRYLAESIRRHPDQETLKTMILEAGFDHCEYHNLTGGVVALHKCFKY